MDEEVIEPKRKTFSPQLRRLVVACVLMLVIWVFFLQLAPRRVIPAPAPMVTETPASAEEPKPQIPAPEPDPKLQSLEIKLDHLTELAAKPSENNEAVRALDARLNEQARTIDTLKTEQARVLSMLTLLDAFDRLKTRVLTGSPYATELERLSAIAPSPALSEALKPLQAAAESGIPSLAELKDEFTAAATSALYPAPAEDAGFWKRLRYNASKVITIRRVGSDAGTSYRHVLARAEAAVERNDIAAAAEEVEGLNTMGKWHARAALYLQRDALLDAVKAALTPAAEHAAPAP